MNDLRGRQSGGARLQRLRELGVAGTARRLQFRLLEPHRAAARRRWTARYVLAAESAAPDEGLRGRLLAAPFYFDASRSELREVFLQRFPEPARRLFEQAERALGGDLSWVVPGGSPDWHRALPGEGRWPAGPSESIDIGGAAPPGDVRLAWEVGRCTHLVRLAQAAWLSGDARYAQAAVAGLVDFARANPPGFGVAWIQAQEVALRALGWLWVFRLIGGTPAFDAEAFRLWLGQMEAHGAFVEAFLTQGPITHNHRLTELAALYVLGTALPDLPGARRWQRRGARGMARETLRQLHADGPSGEGSTHYHAFVLDSCVAGLLLAERTSAAWPDAESARDRVASGAEFLRWLIRHDGTLPAIGDSDAGRAFRLGLDPLDRRDVLAAAAVLFGRSDWGAVAGDASGAFWLSGGRAVPGAGGPPPPGGSAAFPGAGFAVARSGYGADEEIAVFRSGPTHLLPDVLTSHLHADALSVCLRLGGADLLRDPGTYLYSEGEGWRALFRGTASHSCVVVDGLDQTDVRSQRFGIGPIAPAVWRSFEGTEWGASFEAELGAAAQPRVRRRAVWLRGGTLLLCDDVLGEGSHGVDVWLQLPGGEATGGEPGELHLQLASGLRMRIRALEGAREATLLRPGEGPGPGWHSPRFGVKEAATAARLSAGPVALPHRVVTLIDVPGRSREAGFCELPGGELELAWSTGSVSLPRAGGIRWHGTPAPRAS